MAHLRAEDDEEDLGRLIYAHLKYAEDEEIEEDLDIWAHLSSSRGRDDDESGSSTDIKKKRKKNSSAFH